MRRRPGRGPLLGAALAVVVLGAAATYLTLYPPWKSKAPAPPAAVPPASMPPAQATAPAPGLPTLDASDAFVRALAAAFSSHPELARWLAETSLVRTLTAVVAHVATGETPRLELPFLAPKQRFRAAGRAGRILADRASYAEYDLFGDAVASIDASAAATAYASTEPLFDAAYRELGYQGRFRPALDTAIRELVAVPAPSADAELVPASGGFRWADPKLEALTSAQKQFLRTGPRNVRLVQAKLRELQTALAALPAATR